jgi:2-(3-amino-3-carboxypropyl)histidine synthase
MNEIRKPDVDKVLRKRCAAIERSLDAQSFGILVSTKIGQCRKDLAFDLCEMAKAHGLDAHVLFADMITPEALAPFCVDAFVNTACPRIAIDNTAVFPVPVLTPIEFEVVVGVRKWEDLVFDEIL